MRHCRGVPAVDVQHLILDPPDIAGTKEDRRFQGQSKATAARAAGQALQVVHQLRSACGDGLGLHATILPCCQPSTASHPASHRWPSAVHRPLGPSSDERAASSDERT
jgi:hypothetical protein